MARVKKIMLADVPTLKKEAKIDEAINLLSKSQTGCVVILENKAPIGIVTELDVIRNLASGSKSLKDSVSGVMSSPVTFMSPDMKLDEALKIKNIDIVNELSLPPIKIHCSVLAEDAIKSAIADYQKKHGIASSVQIHGTAVKPS